MESDAHADRDTHIQEDIMIDIPYTALQEAAPTITNRWEL